MPQNPTSKGKSTTDKQLPEGWRETVLKEVGKVITGKTPKRGDPHHWGDCLDFVTPTDFKQDEKYLSNIERKLSEEGASMFRKITIPAESVMVTCIGSDMGKVAKNHRSCVTNQQINSIIINTEKNDSNFIYYAVRASYSRLGVLAGGGSTMPIINKGTFENFAISCPPLPTQRRIAAILTCLDDKIDLLRRENKTLEAIAQTLFKRWFVEFNFPFDFAQGKPNAEGKPYRESGGKMVESELGMVPEGWQQKGLSDIAKFLNGLAMQKFPQDGPNYLPVIKIRELNSGVSDQTDKTSVNIPEEYIVLNEDVLFSWSGSLELVIWNGGKGALNQHLFKVTSDAYPKWFYYFWTKHHLQNFRAIASAKATTMGHNELPCSKLTRYRRSQENKASCSMGSFRWSCL